MVSHDVGTLPVWNISISQLLGTLLFSLLFCASLHEPHYDLKFGKAAAGQVKKWLHRPANWLWLLREKWARSLSSDLGTWDFDSVSFQAVKGAVGELIPQGSRLWKKDHRSGGHAFSVASFSSWGSELMYLFGIIIKQCTEGPFPQSSCSCLETDPCHGLTHDRWLSAGSAATSPPSGQSIVIFFPLRTN